MTLPGGLLSIRIRIRTSIFGHNLICALLAEQNLATLLKAVLKVVEKSKSQKKLNHILRKSTFYNTQKVETMNEDVQAIFRNHSRLVVQGLFGHLFHKIIGLKFFEQIFSNIKKMKIGVVRLFMHQVVDLEIEVRLKCPRWLRNIMKVLKTNRNLLIITNLKVSTIRFYNDWCRFLNRT